MFSSYTSLVLQLIVRCNLSDFSIFQFICRDKQIGNKEKQDSMVALIFVCVQQIFILFPVVFVKSHLKRKQKTFGRKQIKKTLTNSRIR